MTDDTPKDNAPWMIALRVLFGCLGIFIVVKYLAQLPSGSIEWASGEGEGTDLTYMYRASTPEALLAAVASFGGFALGFLAFAVAPRIALKVRWIVPWVLVCVIAGMLLQRLSELTSITSPY